MHVVSRFGGAGGPAAGRPGDQFPDLARDRPIPGVGLLVDWSADRRRSGRPSRGTCPADCSDPGPPSNWQNFLSRTGIHGRGVVDTPVRQSFTGLQLDSSVG
jgi:hypothetical protein